MGKIYLVRHGETAWNRANTYVGATDIALNARGREQAEMLAEFLAQSHLQAVYSSDLSRARETAEAIAARHGMQVQPVPGLREVNYGEWEGLNEAEMVSRYPETYEQWRIDPVSVRIPGGETFGELRERAFEAFREIALAHADSEAVIVAHKSVNRVILCGLLGIDIARYRMVSQGNACLNVVRTRKDGFVVDAVNETCHLMARQD